MEVQGDNNTFSDNVTYSNADGVVAVGNSNRITGNLVGLDPSGTWPASNLYDGISVRGSYTTIGGSNAADRNVIACCGGDGIAVGPGPDCQMLGNWVGVNTGGVATGNIGEQGINLWGSDSSNLVVGGAGDARNVIVGAGYHGILVSVPGTPVVSNWVGLTPLRVAVGNGFKGAYDGIRVVADDVSLRGNVICASSNGWGVYVNVGENCVVAGNYIGTDLSTTNAYGNGPGGVYVINATNILIGGSGAADRNYLVASRATSTNNGAGVCFDSVFSFGSRVVGNYIGVAADGYTALGNTNYGVLLIESYGIQIGSTNSGQNNLISGERDRRNRDFRRFGEYRGGQPGGHGHQRNLVGAQRGGHLLPGYQQQFYRRLPHIPR